MARTEFTRETKRAALKRSNGQCEAVGDAYGLDEGQRYGASVAYVFHVDHIVPDGLGGDTSLENAAGVCMPCHRVKTAVKDVPQIAKMKRQRDKHLGLSKPKKPWSSRKMNQQYMPNTKYIDREN